MKLIELITAVPVKSLTDSSGKPIKPSEKATIGSIHYRSDDVRPEGLFIALKGFNTDGHKYVDDAVKRGAIAIVVEKPVVLQAVPEEVVIVEVENTRTAMPLIAAHFYNHPLKKLSLIGITGTNGKTTITYLLERILQESGLKTGVIGTINYRYDDKVFDNPMTTPESLDLHRIFADMTACGVTHVIMEVSSHAIELNRIGGCQLDIAVFTNLSQDHLDFHETMEAYFECKKKLFTDFLKNDPTALHPVAVINIDDPRGMELMETLNRKLSDKAIVSVGTKDKAAFCAHDVNLQLSGISGVFRTPAAEMAIHSKLVGHYNLENILCAAGTAYALGIPAEDIINGIAGFETVPGRLESVDNQKGRYIFVDYAHTPDALENILSTLRALSSGRLISVFGCGGDRDQTKRPKMGRIAAKYSDLCIVTSDNPRSEDPNKIIDLILKGVEKEIQHRYTIEQLQKADRLKTKGYAVEPDRKNAILLGILASRIGDTVVIAGKGHETYQILNEGTIDFDDRIEAGKSLASL